MSKSLSVFSRVENNMGGYKSLYLSDSEKKFSEKYLNNFNDWVKEQLHEAMENTPEYCETKIAVYNEKLEQWKKRQDQAKKEQAVKTTAREKLITEYNRRPTDETRKGFLNGKTGQRLLKKAGYCSIARFINSLDKEEGDID